MRPIMTSTRKAWLAISFLFLDFAVPVAAGLATVLDTRSKHIQPEWVAVSTLRALPEDGVPQLVPVRVSRFDAWSRMPDDVVGHVFLRRVNKTTEVRALSALYQGGTVEYDTQMGVFNVPCWNVQCDIDGRRLHTVREWGDMQPVRTLVRGDVVCVNVVDAIPKWFK